MSDEEHSEFAETFGNRLRFYRERMEYSVPVLAQMVGVTEGAIRQMESGQTRSASFPVALKLAYVLYITPWVLAGTEPPSLTKLQQSIRYQRLIALGVPMEAVGQIDDVHYLPPLKPPDANDDERALSSLRDEVVQMNDRLGLALDRIATLEAAQKPRVSRRSPAAKNQK